MLWTLALALTVRFAVPPPTTPTPSPLPPIYVYFSGIIQFFHSPDGSIRVIIPNLIGDNHEAIVRFPNDLKPTTKRTLRQCPRINESILDLRGDAFSIDADGTMPLDKKGLVDLVRLGEFANGSPREEIFGDHPKPSDVSGAWTLERGTLVCLPLAAQYYLQKGFLPGVPPFPPAPLFQPRCLYEAVVLQLQPKSAQFSLRSSLGNVSLSIPPGANPNVPIIILVANAPQDEECVDIFKPSIRTGPDTHFALHYKSFTGPTGPTPDFPQVVSGCGILENMSESQFRALKPENQRIESLRRLVSAPLRAKGDGSRATIMRIQRMIGGSNCPPGQLP